jgi:hypothetical protein
VIEEDPANGFDTPNIFIDVDFAAANTTNLKPVARWLLPTSCLNFEAENV